MHPMTMKMNSGNIPEFHRYVRLQVLIGNYGDKYAQFLLQKEFEKSKGTSWQNGSAQVKIFLQQDCSAFYQTLKKDQKEAVDKGDIAQFDLTLTSSILATIIPFATSVQGQHLKKLVEVRNTVKHGVDMAIEKDQFELLWNTSASALAEFGMPQEDIQSLKTTVHLNSIKLTETEYHPENSARARRLRRKGKCLQKVQDYKGAIHVYTKGLALAGLTSKDKCFLQASRAQAVILHLKTGNLPGDEISGSISSAYEDAHMILSTDPRWWVGYHLLGQVHHYKGELQEAMEWFDRALAINSRAAEAQSCLDVCRLEQSREECLDYCSPFGTPCSLDEQASNFMDKRGFGMSGDSLKQHMKECLHSSSPEIRGSGLLIKARLFQQGIDQTLDLTSAFNIYLELATLGQTAAYADLGVCYLLGEGVKQDLAKAIFWIERSSHAGSAYGLYYLAHMYKYGIAKTKDEAKAMALYLKASDEGLGAASHNVGLFYLDGIGCFQDMEKAKQYFTLAALRGMPFAMDHLAWIYLNEGCIELAVAWYKRAAEGGSFHSLMDSPRFKQAVNEKRTRIRMENLEKVLKICGTHARSKSNQAKSKAREQAALVGIKQLIDEGNYFKDTIWEHVMEIRERAQQGYIFAQELLAAMNCFNTARGNMLTNQEYALALFAECLRTNINVFDFTPDVQNMLKFICCNMLAFSRRSSGLHLNVRVCTVGILLSRNYFLQLFPYLEGCIAQYPEEKFFHEVLAHLLAKSGRLHESLEVFEKALKRFLDDPVLLSGKMQVMTRLIGKKTSTADVMKSCKWFICKAYPDDKMVPEAYFTLAFLETWNNNKERAKQFYAQGLQAEGLLISYFLPYQSYIKELVENLLASEEDAWNCNESSENEDAVRQSQVSSPIRCEATVDHRRFQKEVHGKADHFFKICLEPMHQQENLEELNLKDITLREMYPFGDKIHKGRKLQLLIVEKPWDAFNNCYSVVKDKNHECIRIVFQNFSEGLPNLSVGSTISIINPYFRLAIEAAKRVIRVDDPKSIVFGEDFTICRYCWKDEVDMDTYCESCMAAYCSPECRTKDIQLLKHSFICP